MTPDELEEVLGLVQGSDTVELKMTVGENAISTTSQALGFDSLDAEIRHIVLFDTPDLALYRSGVVVRARRIQGGGGDTVVKLRPVVPGQLPSEVRSAKRFGIETDAMPGGFVCSGSMKGKSTAAALSFEQGLGRDPPLGEVEHPLVAHAGHGSVTHDLDVEKRSGCWEHR